MSGTYTSKYGRGEEYIYRILDGKTEGKRSLGKTVVAQEDNIKMDITEV